MYLVWNLLINYLIIKNRKVYKSLLNNFNFQADVDFQSMFNWTPPKSPVLIKKKKKKKPKRQTHRDRKMRGKKEKKKRHIPIVSVYPIFQDCSAIVRAFNPVIMRGIREIRRWVSGSSSFTGLSWISTTFLEGTIFRRSRGIEPSK